MKYSQDTGDNKVVLGGTALLIVDPQLDFHEGGSLAVPGATADAERIAQLVTDHTESIDEIIVTLDSHHVSECFWVISVWQIREAALPGLCTPRPSLWS